MRNVEIPQQTLDRKTGMLVLIGGDDWKIFGKVVDPDTEPYGECDLTGWVGVASFPGVDPDTEEEVMVDAAITVSNPTAGEFYVSVPRVDTGRIHTSERGIRLVIKATFGEDQLRETWESDALLRVR